MWIKLSWYRNFFNSRAASDSSLRAQLLKLPDYHIVGTREFEAAELKASSEDAYGGVMAATGRSPGS
ncbi:MAG: hypothetical protein U0361_19950 [Nitrospiraceae bacterium]